ncbi:MAG: sigma-54-dependent Fis family transcriptional regulator [Lewinella sp.]|nr:sigma-54-dependent Fis family transcriptional regulator [Lewinella sp.]
MNLQATKQRYGIIGRSEALDRALDTALRVAGTDLTVLITGESGVGKEIFSRVIHDNSPRKHEGFIAINCGAIPEGTINSELFGHEKGSFTGATGERKGYFETYDGGTIFLDEIGEMPSDTQAYLLRVLETGEFIRVGSSKPLRTDVRIIAATNVDLREKIKKGKFREDLFYRLNTVPIQLPPLRERAEDIYMLFRKFAVDFAERYRMEPLQIDERARRLLESYHWPGNIRELKNVAEQLSILSEERQMSAEDLLEVMPQFGSRHLPSIPGKPEEQGSLQEREILYKVLFDMKSDLNDLKSLVFQLIRSNDLRVPDTQQLRSLLPSGEEKPFQHSNDYEVSPSVPFQAETETPPEEVDTRDLRPIILSDKAQQSYDESEVIEENLSLADNEKELIRKALKKHNGRRKEAAADLGISERTLYRKIKEYDL